MSTPAHTLKKTSVTVPSFGKASISQTKFKAGADVMAMVRGEKETKTESRERIEDKVLNTPGLGSQKDNALFQGFLKKIVPKIRLPATSLAIVESFSNIDVTAERIAQVLKSNPYYEYQFLKYIESISRREEMPSLEAAVVLLGMQNSRNLVLSLQLNRLVKGGHPEWTKEGKLKVAPAEILRYALKTEEILAGKKNSYPDTAYAGGLLFDLFSLVGGEIAEDKKKFETFLDSVFSHGLRAAQVADEVSGSIPEVGFKKFVFAGSLIHDCGKLVMALLDPTYYSFCETFSQKEVPAQLREYTEWKRYGITHSVLGAMCCNYFGVFQPIEKAILHHHEPFQLRLRNRNLFQLAAMICLSSNVSNHFKKTERKDDPVMQLWRGPELTGFNVELRHVAQAVNRLS